MAKFISSIIVLLATATFTAVDSYRAEFLPGIPSSVRQPPPHVLQQQQQQGCEWSTLTNSNNTLYPPFLQQRNVGNSLSLDCKVRTLNGDFWSSYGFSGDQLEKTSRLTVKCNDKLFFESVLDPSQSYFRLRNLQDVSVESCKIRKIPTRIFSSLGFLKSLSISSLNGEWSPAVGMQIEIGAFEGLSNLEKLDLSQNNIWGDIHNVFCPLRSLLTLNVSHNLVSDTEDLGFGSSGSCVMNIQSLDLSFNKLRRLNSNAFQKLKISQLRLQNNLIEEIQDNAFDGLAQMKLLNLSSNRLVALAPGIFKPNPRLRQISLCNNSIAALTQVFSGLTQLLSVDLSRNALTYIDATIFKDNVNLQFLSLAHNRIENLNPAVFQTLANLRQLDISNNKLAVIDSRHFSNQYALTNLYLDHNKIREMDEDSLKNCTNLQDLGLADNLLPEVPKALRGLKHLVTLDIAENRIEVVGNESFSGLGQLYGLRMVANRITELSAGFCDHMTKLRVLNVADNRINKIAPTAFSGCPEIRALRLDSNDLEEITIQNQLSNVLWLNVSNNRIGPWVDYELLPPTVEWVDFSHNNLESVFNGIGGTRNTSSVPSLRVLDLSYNKLTNLDYTIVPPTIEQLRVNFQKGLTNIAPDTFKRANRLRRVELIGNQQLESIPLAALRLSPIGSGKPVPEFFLAGTVLCNCQMEWLTPTRLNQLAVLRQYPRVVDLDKIVCNFPRANQQPVPLIETKPQDFLCPYKSHCTATCGCCEFDACDCEMTCPDSCECLHDTAWSVNIVECSNLNFSQVPPRIPMEASELYLDGNNFPSLDKHIFLGKKNLRALYLNSSQIEKLNKRTFTGLNSLISLHLEDNLLEEIDFEFDLTSLKELYLQNNRLRYLSKEAFARLTFLQVLRIDSNNLFNYPVWSLSNLHLNSLMLAKNTWSCDCEFLIPFRAWVAAKRYIVGDFEVAKCQFPTVGSNNTEYALIQDMCDHNKELNFNFNPNDNGDNIPAFLESELLNSNHISAEKVASPSDDMSVLMGSTINGDMPHIPVEDISGEGKTVKQEGSELWTIFTSVLITLVIVLLVIAFVLFRKNSSNSLLPFCVWLSSTSSCGDEEDAEAGCNGQGRARCFKLFPCCCASKGKKVGKKCRSSRGSLDDADKLFDAYFLYSRKDEDLVTQKIAPELESVPGTLPPPPPLHGGNGSHHRLCLHYRDLCLSAENPLNPEMILSACDASKRIVLVISRPFLQNELSHPGFRSAIQTAISRHQNKFIFILLPPFTEQNFQTIYPELKAGNFTAMTLTKGGELSSAANNSAQIASLEWSDKNFWSKLKLMLPTPTLLNSACSPSGLNSTSTISSTGSSAIFNMTPAYHPNSLINYNNSLSLHEYAYNTVNSQHHQYHRNIVPFNAPSVPKHHIALGTPSWHHQQQVQNQNFYNNSQHSQIIPIPGYPAAALGGPGNPGVTTPLMLQNSYHHQPNIPSFNESFRRHLQLQQNQNKLLTNGHHQHHASNCSGSSQGHAPHPHHHNHHHHQGSHCSSSHSSSTSNNNPSLHPYQPLDANYSSSSSNEELLDHVYSTLDSPPIMSAGGSNSNNSNGCESNGELVSKQINSIDEQERNENASLLQNRLNSNNCAVAANNISSGQQSSATPQNNGTNNNGTMYFV